MENSAKKSGGVVIPKKKRSLDLKSLYESRSSEVGGSKKNDSGENDQKDVTKKRKSRKEISLNSLEPDAKKSRKDDGNGMKSEMGFREKLDMWSKELHGISLALDDNGSPFNIPKRPRGSVGRKKLESDQGSETWRISNSVDRVVAFKAEDRKFEDKGGPTDQLIKLGKDGALKSRLAVKSVGSQNKSKRKAESQSTMDSSGLSVKLNKMGSDEGVDRVGAFEPEVTKSEDKGGPNDQSVRSVTLSAHVTGKVIGLNKKSKRKGDPKSTMNSSSLNMKSKKVGADQGIDSVGAFEAEVTESEDKDGPIDQSVRSVALSAGNDVSRKFLGYNKKSMRKADSKSTMNFRSSNVKSKKKVGSDEVVDHIGASEAEDTKSADKGCPDDQSVWSAIFSGGNDLDGKDFGLNRKSKRRAHPKSTMNSSSSNVKLKKRVGAEVSDNVGAFVAEVTKSVDKDGRNDQSVRPVTLSAGNDVGGKVRGLNKKSKQKARIKSTMKNSSSSNVKLKVVGADEAIVCVGALEVEFTKSENKSGPNDQPVMPDTFYEDDHVAEKNIGVNKKSKQNVKRISTTNASSSNVKLNKGANEAVDRVGEIEADVTISEDKGPIDQSVRPVNYTAGNRVARKLVGLNRKSKRKAHPKSTMNAGSSNVKLKKVGADETFDCVGEYAAEVIISKDRDVAGKVVGVNKKSKRKSDPKSTMNSSSSNVKLKKVGADESIDNVGAFVAEVTKYDDKGVTIDQSVRSDTLSASNDVVGKVAAVNKKSKRKADPRSTLKSNSSNMMLKKVGAGEAIDRVGAFEAEFTKSEDKDGRNEQLVRSVTLGQDGISNSKLAGIGKVIGSNTKSKRKADRQSTMTSSSSNKKLKKVGADEDVVQVGACKAEVTKPEDKGGPDDQLVGSVILSADKDGVSDLRLAGKVIGTNTKAKRKTDAKSTLNLSNSDAKQKQVRADEIKGGNYCQPDSVRHVVKESKVVVNNGNAPSKKRLSNSRKKKDLVVGGDSAEALVKMSEPGVGSSAPNSPFIDFLDEDDDDDDEENLEQNAARMLSSRFDPRCTGFTSKKKSSVSQTVDELSFPVSSARDSIRQRAKSLGDGASDSGDDNSRELRPRGGDKGRSLSRKRRHFYDIPTRDLDPRWVLNRRIKIFWPLDESWYFGYVTGYHSEAKLHHLKYDDGEEEWVNLEEENFRLLLLRTEVPGKGISRRRTAAKDTHAEQTARPVDDASCIGDDDSEPIASWLATQSQRVKALSKSSQRRKISQNYPSLGSLLSSEKTDNSNGDADASRPMGKKSGCESTSADKILVCGTVDKSQFVYVRKKFQKKRAGNSYVSKGGKARGSAPWPVTKRDMLGYGCVDVSDKQLRSFDDRSNLTLNDVLLESKEFRIQICLPLLPYLEFCWGIGFFRLFHDIFMLQHGVIVTTSPAVFLELLFVDSNIGLRSVLFEGCLIQALAIVFLILTVFSHSDDNCNGELELPVTSIRFQLSSVHNLRKQHVFAFHSFFRLARSKWLYLESKIMQQCLLIEQLPVSECTYCNIKELECGILRPCKPHFGSEFSSREGFRKNLERDNLPTGVSEETFNTGKPANVPPFTLSFSAAPSLFLSLHLQSLMKHGFAGANFQHQDPLCSPESSGNGGSPVAECSQFTEHENSQLDSEASAFRGLSSYQQDLEMDVVLAGNAIENANSFDKLHKGLSSDQHVDMPFDRKGCISRQTSDASWNAHDGFILNSNIMGPKGSLKRRKSSTISSLLGQHSLVMSDSQPNFMHHGFSNGPRKPRTQVQYTLPFTGYEICTRQETSSPGSIPCKRIRRASLRKIPDGSGNNPKNLELLTCSANVLITNDDRGWRECGAHIFWEVADDNEWRLAVKISGITKFSYKVKHILQPGSTNRYSHAMIWKGGKDWVLEFPDRNQWMLFKELYEECHNRNMRAACVKNIPIPGVRLVDESDDIRDEVPFVRNPTMYFRQIQTDAEMAMDPSYILYDMDSDDEQWLATQRNCTDKHKIEKISEEFFEMAINMFEKVSYSQQRDNLTDAEIEEVAIVIGSVEAAKLIYLQWRLKREKTCMPLIRHLQPPPWQRYQKQVKEWEHNVSRSIQEKISPPEKPPMFAFCFKPRGLDVPNRTSKQRSHRKFSVSALHHASSGDHSLLFNGRRSNGHAYGDEKTLYASGVHDSSDVSPSLHPSARILSSRDAHFTLSASVSEWKVNDRKVHKNKRRKKLGFFQRTATGDNNSNGIQQWKMGPPELFSQSHYYLDGPTNQGGPKQPDISDLHEFHLRDALGASKHARTVAKLKREKAQKLFCKADFAIHKAVSALMQAEAIKDFFENSNGVN